MNTVGGYKVSILCYSRNVYGHLIIRARVRG
jgi:hypothetical protein